jgi:hypothetical protein
MYLSSEIDKPVTAPQTSGRAAVLRAICGKLHWPTSGRLIRCLVRAESAELAEKEEAGGS